MAFPNVLAADPEVGPGPAGSRPELFPRAPTPLHFTGYVRNVYLFLTCYMIYIYSKYYTAEAAKGHTESTSAPS